MADVPRKRYRRADLEKSSEEEVSDPEEELYVPLKERRKLQFTEIEDLATAGIKADKDERNEDKGSGSDSDEPEKKDEQQRSLFDEHARLRLERQRKEILADQIRRQEEEELKILEAVREERALLSAKELASGVIYDKPLKTAWTPPKWILKRGDEYAKAVRKKMMIIADGKDCPAPCKRFVDMKLPKVNLI